MRVAVGLIWVVLVPAEILGICSCLRYLIPDCRDRLDYGELISALQIIGGNDWGLDSGLQSLNQVGIG